MFATTLFVYNGLPPLVVLIVELFTGFFFVGILFGNLNSLAMQPLGNMAGLGAAIIGSLSSMFSVPIALTIDSFLAGNLYPIGLGFLFFFSLAAACVKFAQSKEREATTEE